ncbi:hypothetical protein JCM16358_00120 [Halanaerocella petrolearia]
MKQNWNKQKIELNEHEKEPLEIISDGMIMTKGVGNGRGIPIVIVDSSLREDFEQLVKAHKQMNLGDVKSFWAKESKTDRNIMLILFFKKPSEVVIILEFEMPEQGMLVDKIVQSQALYIQPGKEGDSISNTNDNPKILAEIPSRNFREEWEKIWVEILKQDFKKRGLKRGKAEEASEKFIEEMRELDYWRMK